MAVASETLTGDFNASGLAQAGGVPLAFHPLESLCQVTPDVAMVFFSVVLVELTGLAPPLGRFTNFTPKKPIASAITKARPILRVLLIILYKLGGSAVTSKTSSKGTAALLCASLT